MDGMRAWLSHGPIIGVAQLPDPIDLLYFFVKAKLRPACVGPDWPEYLSQVVPIVGIYGSAQLQCATHIAQNGGVMCAHACRYCA